jgi:hypothetical protein
VTVYTIAHCKLLMFRWVPHSTQAQGRNQPRGCRCRMPQAKRSAREVVPPNLLAASKDRGSHQQHIRRDAQCCTRAEDCGLMIIIMVVYASVTTTRELNCSTFPRKLKTQPYWSHHTVPTSLDSASLGNNHDMMEDLIDKLSCYLR